MHLSCNAATVRYCLLLSIFRDLRPIVLAVILQIGGRGALLEGCTPQPYKSIEGPRSVVPKRSSFRVSPGPNPAALGPAL